MESAILSLTQAE